MYKNSIKIKKMAGTAILIALAIVFQLLSKVFIVGPFNINLAIVVIALAAILYGPVEGALVGLIDGIVIMFIDPTAAFFMGYNVFLTIFLVLLKTTLAGAVSAFAFKGLKKFNFVVAIVVASLLVPLVNTLTFGILTPAFFHDGVVIGFNGGNEISNYGECLKVVFLLIYLNGLVEIGFTVVLSPAIVYVTKVLSKNKSLGFSFEEPKTTNDKNNQ